MKSNFRKKKKKKKKKNQGQIFEIILRLPKDLYGLCHQFGLKLCDASLKDPFKDPQSKLPEAHIRHSSKCDVSAPPWPLAVDKFCSKIGTHDTHLWGGRGSTHIE